MTTKLHLNVTNAVGIDTALAPVPESVATGITCLRCRQCKPTDETDFSRVLRFERGRVSINTEAIVPIRCEKTGRARPAHLWQPCPLADDRYVGARQFSDRGDKQREFGEVELLFWRTLAPKVSLEDHPKLLAATGRKRHSLHTLRQRYGIKSKSQSREAIIGASIDARVRSGASFNAEQATWIEECRAQGLYPDRIRGKTGATNPKQERLRERLLEGIAERGAPKKWRQVVSHVYYSSPAAKRARALKQKLACVATGSVTAS